MRRSLVAIACAGLLALPVAAHAECQSAPECLQIWLGPIRANTTFALVTGALAAPVILAGGIATAVQMANAEPTPPAGVLPIAPVNGTAPPKKARPKLALIPTDPPPSGRPLTPQERAAHDRAVQINDAITNVGIAIGGAAVVGGIIYGIIKK
jgi:hypothetical protein